jgi:hypothetical protein
MTGWLKPISGFPQKQQQQPFAPLIQLYLCTKNHFGFILELENL